MKRFFIALTVIVGLTVVAASAVLVLSAEQPAREADRGYGADRVVPSA